MSKREIEDEYRKFAKWANKIGKSGLVQCSSGNLSYRLSEDTILVSESRRWLVNLKQDQVVKVNLKDGAVIEGEKPTGELPLHLSILRQNTNINTVLHCQSPAATALACRKSSDIDYNVIIEIPIYIGHIAHLPFIMPGSQELADAVASASVNSSVMQLQNHGQIITGIDYRDVYQKAVFFELACSIIISNGINSQSLTPEQCKALMGYR